MGRLILSLMFCLAVSAGCKSTRTIYEQEDLITIAHNSGSDYTLLVYRNTRGQTRKVLRRKGICEMMLVETDSGEFLFKERGHEAKLVVGAGLRAIETHIEGLIYQPAQMTDNASAEGDVF